MGQAGPSDAIEAHIEGEVSGQVAVGKYILQIGSVHGGVVQIAAPGQQPQPRPRSTPVFLRPRPFPDLLNREEEVDAATSAFQSATPVAFYGPAGIGKTVLLRHLAHRPEADRFPDGIVYLLARGRTWDDLLQSLFDAFYETDGPFKPTEAQVRLALREKQALILLDDVGLARDEVEALMDMAPRSVFVLTSEVRCLWGEGRAVGLDGLPLEDALALVERELGRPLSDQERPAAEALCTGLKGHPLHILQAAALVREEGRSLEAVARSVQVPTPAEALASEALTALPEPQRRLLAVLALLDGAPLPAEHLAALSGVRDVEPVLQALMRRGLAQAHSPRYSLAGGLGAYLRGAWDLSSWMERALAHFTSWVEAERPSPTELAGIADAVLRTLEWAVAKARWSEVLRLGRAVEGYLALLGRWEAWNRVLRWMLRAARALGNRAVEAWALHQIGTRSLCVGDASAARDALAKALRLRQSLGDEAGAAVTRHNLDLLAKVPPPRRPSRPAPKPGLSAAALIGIGLAAIVGLVALVGLGWHLLTQVPTPTPPSPPPTEMVWSPEPPQLVAPEPEEVLPCEPREAERWVEWRWSPTSRGVEGYEFYLEALEPEREVYPAQFVEESSWGMSLPCGGTYLWRVRAVGPEGNAGEWSEERVFYVGAVDQEGPPAPSLVAPKDGEQIPCPNGEAIVVPFRWGPVDDPSGIDIYEVQIEAVVYETPIGTPPSPLRFGTGDPSAEVELPCGWNYRWRVRATDGAGNSGEWSPWWEFRAMTLEEGDTLPPPAPVVIGPGGSDVDDPENLYPCDQVVLQWVPVEEDPSGSGIQGYQVSLHRYNYGTEEWERIEPYFIIYDTSIDVTEWLSVGLYAWRVWAIDNAGNDGDPSPWLYFECPLG